jgi:hypothetical protein
MIPQHPGVRVRAVDALLSGLVDYAGLFPPATEGMREALENYASYLAGADRQALGRFIVPIARLEELEDASAGLMPRDRKSEPWHLSVLVTGDVSAAADQMQTFNKRYGSGSKEGHAVIDVVELKAGTASDVARQRSLLPSFMTYFEIPTKGDVTPLVKAIALSGARAKIRTGGVTPESIPPASEIIDFIIACRRESVPFKATAGLHHPIRGSYKLTYEPDGPVGTMYGFLNVFVGSALIYAGESEDTATAALEETDPAAFTFEDDAIVWDGKRIPAEQMEESRLEFAISFGSCSFREPVDELKPLARRGQSDRQ